MESSEFILYFSKFPKILKLFDGTCSIDTVPKRLHVHHFIICNTGLANTRGKHWFLLYRPNKNTIECFDSLGNDDSKKTFLLKNCSYSGIEYIKVNLTPLQQSNTDTCGKFCLMFIVERFHNPDLDFEDLLNSTFSDDRKSNEAAVIEFFNTILAN